MGRAKMPIVHGTAAGYQTHCRRGERPCVPCVIANNQDVRRHRIETGKIRAIRVDVELVGLLLMACVSDATRDRVHDVLGDVVADACVAQALAGDRRD